MSLQAITAAFAISDVSSSEKLLLISLANYADENGSCYPSQRRLAEDTCLSDRTIRQLLTALEARGLLSRRERKRPDGSRSSDVITLHFAGAQISGGAETISGGVRKSVPGGAEMVSGLTTFEPVTEPKEIPKARESQLEATGFAEFWRVYPNKVGKDAARKAYASALRRIEGPDPPGEILAGVTRALTGWSDPKFIPHPSTWLNQGRWQDEPPPANSRPSHERPDAAASKFDRHQANLERAFAGSEVAARHRAVQSPGGF